MWDYLVNNASVVMVSGASKCQSHEMNLIRMIRGREREQRFPELNLVINGFQGQITEMQALGRCVTTTPKLPALWEAKEKRGSFILLFLL